MSRPKVQLYISEKVTMKLLVELAQTPHGSTAASPDIVGPDFEPAPCDPPADPEDRLLAALAHAMALLDATTTIDCAHLRAKLSDAWARAVDKCPELLQAVRRSLLAQGLVQLPEEGCDRSTALNMSCYQLDLWHE